MSSHIEEDAKQIINYSCLPLRWKRSGTGRRYPVMSWKVGWPAPISTERALKVLSCVQALTSRSKNRIDEVSNLRGTLETDACNLLDRAAREAANGFQCEGSPALSTWIAAVSDGDDFTEFCYPFLDEVFAQEVGIAAIRLVGELASRSPLFDHEQQLWARQRVGRIQVSLKESHPPNNSMRILAEAQKRGIPFFRISQGAQAPTRAGHRHRCGR